MGCLINVVRLSGVDSEVSFRDEFNMQRREPNWTDKVVITITDFLFEYLKYMFHAILLVLFPLGFYRFWISYGNTPFNSLYVLFHMSIFIFLIFMALWSHFLASKGNDPGFIDWEHFRTNQEL